MNARCKIALLVLLASTNVAADDAKPLFQFRDVGKEAGIFPHLANLRGHGAAWGDANGTGWPDLFVAVFHNQGSGPGALLRNTQGKFALDPQPELRTSGIGSGALLVDLGNTGRLDLYVSNCAGASGDIKRTPSLLFRNDGGGKFVDISQSSGACPPAYQGRGLAALDYDGDGNLDLILCEQYYSSNVKTGPVLLRNLGNYRFENASEAAGLPQGFGGLGVAVGDFNDDGWPDLVFTHGGGENRLYLNRQGKFHEAANLRDVLRWTNVSDSDCPAGVCVGDVNGDGRLDIVIGHHFKRPWTEPAPIHLYLNRGVKGGSLAFDDVTEAAGLRPLSMKPPHVEIQDFDNDGLADIYVSIVKFDAAGVPFPLIYKNTRTKGGVPRFVDPTEKVNDFPRPEMRRRMRSSEFYARMLEEHQIMYSAAAPSADFNRDGKLDLFLTTFHREARPLLLRNETLGGNWLDVRVEGTSGANRMGIGSRVNVYPAGKLGDVGARLGSREIAIGYGYCSGQEAIAHFGLGTTERVDVEVVLPHGKGTRSERDVSVHRQIAISSAQSTGK